VRKPFVSAVAAACLLAIGWAPDASARSRGERRGDDRSAECRPIAQVPLGLTQSQTMRLNVTCFATRQEPAGSCRVTLRFLDDAGDPVASAPALTTRIPVRGVASLDLPGHSFVAGPALREVVRPVVEFRVDDFLSDRLAMNVELFDTATERGSIRYAFEPCRTLPLAPVPRSQRPDGFDGLVHELGFAPPGIAEDETVSLNAICNPDPARPHEPCHVVLRYSPYETGSGRHASPAAPLAEQELSIEPGAIGSFEVPGVLLGATPGSRAMFRPSVVGAPATLRRVVTGFEILDSASGIAQSLYQPPDEKRRPIFLR
jgi:hypothetical protein